jgi:hypothetical protein
LPSAALDIVYTKPPLTFAAAGFACSRERRRYYHGTDQIGDSAVMCGPRTRFIASPPVAGTSPASPTFLATAAVCPSGKQVTGTGSRIVNSGGQVGLQLNRASGPLDISRSTARERANGYAGLWTLTSYAICANPVGLVAEGTLTNSSGTSFTCPTSTHRVHSVGGGGSLVDSGPVFLRLLYPFSNLRTVQVFMTGPPIGGMAIQAVCGP